jgi:hypothetical protein
MPAGEQEEELKRFVVNSMVLAIIDAFPWLGRITDMIWSS